MRYPPADRQPVVDTLHGTPVSDPYRWLEAADAPATVEWSAAQDALARPYLDGLPGRPELAGRLRRLLDAGSVFPPALRHSRAFWMRRESGQQHAVLVMRDGDGDGDGDSDSDGAKAGAGAELRRAERVVLDPAALDPSGLTTLDAWSPSPDGRLLAYQLSSGGDEESVLHVVDVDSGHDVVAPIDRTRYSSVAWLPGSDGFFYVRRLTKESPFDRRVYLRRLPGDGTYTGAAARAAEDEYVFGEGRDPRTYYGVSVSHDGRWLTISASVGTEPRDDVWIADLAAGSAASGLQPVQEGTDARCAAGVAFDGRLYIWTDRDAPRGRLCVADPARPQEWSELVPEDPEAVLSDYALTERSLVVCRSQHAVAELTVLDRESGRDRGSIDLGAPGSLTGLTARREGGRTVWIGRTDWSTPPSVLTWTDDLDSDEPQRWAEPPGTPPAVRPAVRQELYRSADGSEIRVTVLAPTEEPDRPRPTVLYGYGGFGIALEPAYTASALAWVAAGGVWAVAHLRGGAEEGEDWHRAGMRARKQNVFDDLHAAAEHLRGTGRAGKLGIYGGSNGGLLVGAAVTQRPDLYDAVVCSAPLLDMVRYEQFGLGKTWNDEYGTVDDADEFGWLIAYSPYHAVRVDHRYPATLFEVFDSDTRVDPLHARKMCAAMQAVQGDDAPPVLIRRETDVGHAARSVDRTIALSVDTLSFLAEHLGLDLRSPA